MAGDTFKLSGDFRGAMVNIKSTLTNVSQSVGSIPHADEASKDELKNLIQQLQEALEKSPPEKAEEAEAVAKSAEQLVELASQEKPNKTLLQVAGEGLKKTAETLAEFLPTAVTITTNIVAIVSKLRGL